MGNCCCVGDTSLTKSAVAIKFPHGVAGIQYSDDLNQFIHCKDINEWLQSLYLHSDATKWVLYNDETGDIVEKGYHTKGHCKGIVTWGDTSISWLCHSVPNFPREFTGKTISLIGGKELVYGQSFQYIELPYHNDTLIAIMKQLSIMQANIYVSNHDLTFQASREHEMSTVVLTPTVTHIAKSPYHPIDIYSQHIAKEYPSIWHEGLDVDTVKDVKLLHYDTVISQDHSKWAVSETDLYWVGDLDRTTSHFRRGGGGFLIRHAGISLSLRATLQKHGAAHGRQS
jgi:hypothetical protein